MRRPSSLLLVSVALPCLSACAALHPGPALAETPAVLQPEPPRPLVIVQVPKPLPLPGQLKPLPPALTLTPALLLPRVLPVADQQHLCACVIVVPCHPEDLLLAHGRGDGELDYPPHRDDLAIIAIEVGDEAGQLVASWPAIPFVALADKPEALERYSGQIYRLHLRWEAMHRSCMLDHQLDRPDIDAEGHRPGALRGAFPTETHEALAIEFTEAESPEFALEHRESGSFRPARCAPDLFHVRDMEIDEIAEGLEPF